MLREQQEVFFALVCSLMKIGMLDIPDDGMRKGSLPKEGHPVEALVFNQPDESLSESIQVRTSRRQCQRFNASRA